MDMTSLGLSFFKVRGRDDPGFRFSELSSQPRFVNSSALMTHLFGESNRGQFHASDRVLPSHKKLDFLTQREILFQGETEKPGFSLFINDSFSKTLLSVLALYQSAKSLKLRV